MDDRTWLLFTKAACSRDQRVRRQVMAQREGLASRSGGFERLDFDEATAPATSESSHASTNP